MPKPGQDGRDQLTPAGNDMPLLEPKLRLPRLHPGLVARARLLARLDGALERKLALLSAPAGFGKTTLVSQWIATQRDLSTSWVALDSGDNDPVRFWRYVITACQIFQEDLGKASLAHLFTLHASWRSAPGQPSLDAALTEFLNELTYLPGQNALVLEDYHVITTTQIHETLSNFIEHLPPALHVILIARSDPPLPLARWRARDELVELHAADLRFSSLETGDFLHQSIAFPLSAEAIQKLDTRMEGWAAGLRLLALALQGQTSEQEAGALLTTFSGSQRHLLEYFVSETLAAQPEALQKFLLQTSILKRLTASLCDAVMENDESAEYLAALERANLFLQPLDGAGQWYRYHALFAEAMQHEARRRLGEAALQTRYSRASYWYEQHTMPEEAIDAAFAANDTTRAVALVEKLVDRLYDRRYQMGINELFTLHRWLERVPDEELQKHPFICLAYAITLAFTSAGPTPVITPELEAILQMAERVWRAEQNTARLGAVFALRSLILVWQNDIVQGETYARRALACLPDEEIMWRSIAFSIAGAGEAQRGQINAARQTIMQALALSEEIANPHMTRPVLLVLGDIYWQHNKLHQAEELYRKTLADAEDDPADRRRASLGLALLFYEWNKLDAAQQHAQQALDLSKQLADEIVQVQAALILARVQHARGDLQEAHHILQALLAWMQPSKSSLLHREILACQTAFLLAESDLSAVQRWAATRNDGQNGCDTLTPTEAQIEGEELLVARLLIAQNRADEALEILNRRLAAAREAGRIRSILTIQVLASVAYCKLKHTQKAGQTLQEALALAHTEGYQRLFLDEGEPVAALLRVIMPELHEKPLVAYAQSLLDAFTGHHDNEAIASLIEPLSIQEQRVLRLLAAGRSRQEIADELVISLNTVKTHLQHIYQKLNVSSNREAREAARRLRLV
jgi:LuxR family maltose regulon positive regulatory protein